VNRRPEIPTNLIRMTAGTPQIDEEQRTIRNVITTRKLGRDGGIVMPQGIVTKFFEENPVVQAKHGRADSPRSSVIGRSLGLFTSESGMESLTQFADTELGREYAYLYGLNEKREVFMRAWSFGWETLEREYWTLAEARKYLGSDWDEDVVGIFEKRYDEIWVSKRSEMHEYSGVEVGADRAALSRALDDGVNAAGDVIARLDLTQAREELVALRSSVMNLAAINEVHRLTADMQALGRDGAAAATRGDTAGILQAIRDLKEKAELKYERNHNGS